MYNEKPCIYKHTCGFEYCNLSDCPYYEPKTKGRKWAEQELIYSIFDEPQKSKKENDNDR